MGNEEFFLTTSWHATRSVLPILEPSRVIYLVQDDERLLCCSADDRLRCHEYFRDAEVHFVISTETLFDHLVTGAEPLHNIQARGIWFEPARPAFAHIKTRDTPLPTRRQFVFTGSPDDSQDLYWRGLEALSYCLEQNVLSPDDWQFYFIGDSTDELVLPRGARASFIPNHGWLDHVNTLAPAGLGLALRDSPHPGQAVLDLAAAEATVITNRFGRKTSLTRYSKRIICADCALDDLIRAISAGVALASDDSLRPAKPRMETEWVTALQPVINHLFPRA
jgi:hypothetical protein